MEDINIKGLLSIFVVAISFFIVSGCSDSGNGEISEELKLLLDDIVKCTMLEKQLPGTHGMVQLLLVIKQLFVGQARLGVLTACGLGRGIVVVNNSQRPATLQGNEFRPPVT